MAGYKSKKMATDRQGEFSSFEQLHEMIEPIARQLAADKMGLIKDITGSNLPDDLWSQCIPDAIKMLGLDFGDE
jgi:hypothetical protein